MPRIKEAKKNIETKDKNFKNDVKEPERKIARPRQLYTGKKQRNFVPLAKRK